MPIGVGETVGDYAIEEHLGHGTEGDVFLARDVVLGRRVALKTLRSSSAEATHGVEEARLMAGLEHPNIVRVYHAQRQASTWMVIFEHVAGGSLHAHIERAGPLPPARAVELVAQAASGLGHAHEIGILHRDVKPQNLLLSHRGEIKLADFGLAIDARGAARLRGATVGTPAFLAPELWAGGAPTRASDIYSLGGCLYFMLTGRVPFPFSSLEQLERAHRELTPELSPEVPGGVRQVVLAMMAKDPALRPPSASQLARELRALASDPNRQIRAPGMAQHRSPESPIIAGGAELGLAAALIQGPDRIYLERLLELLHGGVRPLQLQATPLSEAKCLLRVALERCAPQRRVSLRLAVSTNAAPLGELLRQKADVAAGSGLERVCQELAAERAGVNTPCVVEVHAAAGLSAPQAADLAAFAGAAAVHDITTVLLAPAITEEPGSGTNAALPGFERLRLPGSGLGAREFVERVRLWISGATAGRGEISADALRLLHHYCREHGHFWAQLTQDSLLISAAARLPVVTTWAVHAAQARTLPLHAVSDVPVECRAPPRRWPSAPIAALLSALRHSEQPRVAIGDS